jgi:hypothetical protein
MKTRSSTQAQDPRQWNELAEAEYTSWAIEREAENQIAFEAWLDTAEGLAWINGKAEEMAERDGSSWWNHDGFNQEPRYAH